RGTALELARRLGGRGETGVGRAVLARRTLEVGDQPALGTGHDLHELPALLAPVVEDGRRVVDQQGRGQILPRGHGTPVRRRRSAADAPSRLLFRELPYDQAYASNETHGEGCARRAAGPGGPQRRRRRSG